ncbi:glycerophosphodiester phosphodiesterase family protein [Parapedobacter soli]|uniref:glycerophosphodiester phosphodiesterase family protein n=1 Tax=Parapedobacter soli TaxID=416955 RepID=UPI0021C6192E|nr:glycerophosphodiester phosphodiesterase family protein [Parapedobacter soli]
MKSRNRLFSYLLLLITAVSCTVQRTQVDHIWHRYHHEPNTVLVAAHRGAHLSVPENSLPSIDEAIKAGAHIVELDVRQTKDGVFVLMHDKTLDRTTTGTGEVKEKTYEELKQIRLTNHGEVTAYHIPTMEEALLRAKGKILVDIDFKADGMQARFDAYRQIADLDVTDHVIFFLYDYTEMATLHAYDPRIKIMPRAYDTEQLDEIIKSGLTDIVHIDASYYNDSLFHAITQRSPIRIWANALGTPDQEEAAGHGGYAKLFEQMKYINVVQTDFPEKMVVFIRGRSESQP